MARPDVLVVGGGVIGCGVAYELAGRGLRVTLLERAGLCSGASGANGSLIWPQGMKKNVHVELSMANWRLFPGLGEELGTDLQYYRTGGLVAIEDEAHREQMAAYVAGQRDVGLPAELLDGDAARQLEPMLDPKIHGAVFAPHAGHVDPFRLTLGYARAARARGAVLTPGMPVHGLLRRGDRVVGVRTGAGDREAGTVVLAAGSWSGPLAATAGVRIPVVPRQGMMIVTETAPFRIQHVLKPIKHDRDPWRFSQPWPPDAPARPAYDPNLPPGKGMGFSQTPAGNLLLGSTSRFVGLDLRPTPDGIHYILSHAARLVPAVRRLRVLRVWAGLRPYTPDGEPLLGPAPGVTGLVLATGHDGSGIGLGPLSARIVAALLTGAAPPFSPAPFDPRRFGES
jgi:sarcosine oxidase subunit beta